MATDQAKQARDRDKGTIAITSKVLPEGQAFELDVSRDDVLAEVVSLTLAHEKRELPGPQPEQPLDELHNVDVHGDAGPVIAELGTPLWDYIRRSHTTRAFAVELVRAIRVNKRWRIAPTPAMTPRAILDLFGLSVTEYSLYLPAEVNPLPVDSAVELKRGDAFEAQKDGKYGGA